MAAKDVLKAARRPSKPGDWLKDAQKAFNAFIRERDRDKPCICGQPLTLDAVGGGFDCGLKHRQRTASEI